MDAEEIMAEAEVRVSKAMDGAMRAFLVKVHKATVPLPPNSTPSLVAAGVDPLTLGTLYGWWTALVDDRVIGAIASTFARARAQHGGTTSMDGAEQWIGNVRDRLVQGIQPPLPEDAFHKVRGALADAADGGWDTPDLTKRIGAVLSWSPQPAYWDGEVNKANAAIDAILDPLGEPGTPAREWARLNDPRVNLLQEARSAALLEVRKDESHWQVRAQTIARTESTGAANFAALHAINEEGFTHKEWISAPDARPEHLAASGQVVPVGEPFLVGGYAMQMPGDANGPAHLVINCRCSVLGVDRG